MASGSRRIHHPFERRAFLIGSAAVGATSLLGACDLLSNEPATNGDRGGQRQQKPGAKEAPMLAAMVEAGDLPPLDKRLPTEPLTVEPNDRIGVYGGDWNTVLLGSADTAWLGRTVGAENLMRWNLEFTDSFPCVAKDVEFNEEGTEFTFTLREGMKWSDGEPFTADDLVFSYNDVLMNADLNEGEPPPVFISGEPGVLEKVDDYTIRFTFDPPHGLFLQLLASPYADAFAARPRHYLEQFHEKYNPDVQQLVEQENQPDWIELFLAKADAWLNPELPQLHPWLTTSALGEGTRVIYERNPYYWKVDPEGNQLPYLDREVYDVVEDIEVVLLKASNGELDMQSRHVTEPRDRPVLAQNREGGDYKFFNQVPTTAVTMSISFNLNAKDPVKREIFQQKDFRIGISHAVNRQEIIDTVFQRQGEPYQVAPRPGSPFYDEEMAKQYTEYDVDLTNEHLDRAGYSARDGDGMRLAPDGNPISFDIDVVADATANVDSLQLIRDYLLEVGVDMRIKAEDRSLFEERREANEHHAAVWSGEGAGGIEPPLRTDWWFPSTSESRNYAPLWMEWYLTAGESGEEPPPEVQEQQRVYQEEVRTEIDEVARTEAMQRVLAMSKEYFYHIGISLLTEQIGIVKNNFHNVPSEMVGSFLWPTPKPTNPEQYFKE